MFKLATEVIGNRYQVINKLGEGGMGAVYRAQDRLNRETVALKRLVTVMTTSSDSDTDGTTNATRLALANEFQTLASLHHPHIIQVLDYGFDNERQPYFTMNLLDEPQSFTQAGWGQPDDVKIRLLTEMLQALVYLHQRGIVHRDLKPDNALVTESGVKVLDFGLAVLHEQKQQSENISGTIAYMAPEAFQGGPITTAVDLYAVGVMAYELFAGHHPFGDVNAAKLIYDIMLSDVDMNVLETQEAVKNVIKRLMQKRPEDRYQSAHEVIRDFSQAVGHPIPIQSAAIRESFLQAARFVGREQELSQLTGALDDAIDRHGSGWLIAGESGVGKSRLLDELRVRALVKGALVLSGQGVSGGGLSYQLWREPLRRLMLSSEISDANAGVLKPIVPDIDELLGRPIPDVPELEGQAGQARLLTTIVSLFHQHRQPIVLILEDLHWTEESLEVLDSLVSVIQDLAVLVVGSYRNDEKPDLPNRVPGMRVINLDRFSASGIEQLSVSMLGDAGREPQVIELLTKQTEGNVFFLVEVLRTLAERAGSLDNIARMTIPFSVFAGGIEQVVRNRLQRLPASAMPLLKFAAVAGRQIDMALLGAVKGDLDLDEWLTNCSNAAVLDVMDERWRFTHDKLREGLLDGMNPEERRTLHRQVAAALETVYADTQDEYAMIIADHYEAAGDDPQALIWAVRAGKHSDEAFASGTAIQYYRKALALWSYAEMLAPSSLLMSRLSVYGRLGELLTWQAHYDQAISVFEAMRLAAEDEGNVMEQAIAWCGTARAQTYQGDMRTALDSATRSEELARAGGTQTELAQALWMQGWVSFRLGNMPAAQELAEKVLDLSKGLDSPSLLANCHNLLGVINSMTGHYPEAEVHFKQAFDTFQHVGLRVNAMSIVNNLGWLAENRGDFVEAFSRYQEALDIARAIGHRDAEMRYLSNLGGMRIILGEFAAAESDLRQVISMAGTSGLDVLSETYRNLAEAGLKQGKVHEAMDAARRALELGREVESQEYIAGAWRVLGQVAGSSLAVMPHYTLAEDVNPQDARDCFAESLRISNEASLDAEKARTLRAWALYELDHGDKHKGADMWEEARQIFAQMGAELEVERMAQLPDEVEDED